MINMIDIKQEEVGFTIQNFQKVKKIRKSQNLEKVYIFKKNNNKNIKFQCYNFQISNYYENRFFSKKYFF